PGEMIIVEEQMERPAKPLQMGQDHTQNMLPGEAGIILRGGRYHPRRSQRAEYTEEKMRAVAVFCFQRDPGRLMPAFSQILKMLVHQGGFAETRRRDDQRQATVTGFVQNA